MTICLDEPAVRKRICGSSCISGTLTNLSSDLRVAGRDCGQAVQDASDGSQIPSTRGKCSDHSSMGPTTGRRVRGLAHNDGPNVWRSSIGRMVSTLALALPYALSG